MTFTEQFAHAVVCGLKESPRTLDSRYLYDARGSDLFDAICQQPEYYLTRIEDEILAQYASTIAQQIGPSTLIELGSGNSQKTHHLLRAFTSKHGAMRYVPIDVSAGALASAHQGIEAANIEGVHMTAIEGRYEDAYTLVREVPNPLILFLGSTLGNFDTKDFDVFWSTWAEKLPAGAHFLIGVDLHKDSEVLEAAYNDAAGVTARFTLNLFTRMNRELGTTLDGSAIEHVARYSKERRRIEICARFLKTQEVQVQSGGTLHRFSLRSGEEIQTEVSRKFEVEMLSKQLESYGFSTAACYTDGAQNFANLLLKRDSHAS